MFLVGLERSSLKRFQYQIQNLKHALTVKINHKDYEKNMETIKQNLKKVKNGRGNRTKLLEWSGEKQNTKPLCMSVLF